MKRKTVSQTDGFNFALFMTPPRRLEPEESERERIQKELNLDTTTSVNDNDKASKNSNLKELLSKDLLKKLDSKSVYSEVSSKMVTLTLNQLESEKVDNFVEDISPINIRAKHFKIDMADINNVKEVSIKLTSPKYNSPRSNGGKIDFDFSTNNFLPRKKTDEQEISSNSSILLNPKKNHDNINEIKINYYENKINNNTKIYLNNPNYYQQLDQQHDNTQGNISGSEYKLNNNNTENSGYSNMYSKNMPINNFDIGNCYYTMPNNNSLNIVDYQVNYANYMSQMALMNEKRNHQILLPNLPTFPIYQQPYSHSYTSQINKPNYMQQQKNNTAVQEKKKRQFTERQGDWVCMKCKNLNFSFRVVCNRCQLPQKDSEELYLEHINNLRNLTMYNDMLQNQVFNQNNGLSPTPSNFNSLLFSPNTLVNNNPQIHKPYLKKTNLPNKNFK